MTTKSSFFSDNAVTYTETNPPGPSSDTLTPDAGNPAPSSFYKNSSSILASTNEAAFSLAVSIAGGPLRNSEWLFGYKFDFAASFAANMTGSQAQARIASTAPATLSLQKNGVEFATLTFNGSNGTFLGSATSFAIGDLLEIIAPPATDPTLAELAITLFGSRN